MSVFFTLAAVAAGKEGDDSVNGSSSLSSGDNSTLVTVMLNKSEPIELSIKPNGSLTYAELNIKGFVTSAIVISDVKSKYFI